MDIRNRLRMVPRSYEDFVNYAAERMEENNDLCDAVLKYMDSNPDANSSDILEVIANNNGLGEPLEIIDDENPARLSAVG